MIESVEEAIEKLILDKWGQTPIDFDNVPFNPKRGTAYIRLQVEWASATSSGPKRTRHNGLVLISVFVPGKIGTKLSAKYADELLNIFKKYKMVFLILVALTIVKEEKEGVLTKLHFYPGYSQRVGEREQWYQRNVVIPFFCDFCT